MPAGEALAAPRVAVGPRRGRAEAPAAVAAVPVDPGAMAWVGQGWAALAAKAEAPAQVEALVPAVPQELEEAPAGPEEQAAGPPTAVPGTQRATRPPARMRVVMIPPP